MSEKRISPKITPARIAKLAAVAAVYVVLTYALGFMSYGSIQFRVAEALMLLCFYRKDYGISMIIGCFVANIFSPMMLMDMIFGTLATAMAVLLIYVSPNLYIASLASVITNAVIVGIELTLSFKTPFWLNAAEVAAGEFVCVSVVGVILFKALEKNTKFMRLVTG